MLHFSLTELATVSASGASLTPSGCLTELMGFTANVPSALKSRTDTRRRGNLSVRWHFSWFQVIPGITETAMVTYSLSLRKLTILKSQQVKVKVKEDSGKVMQEQ